MPTNRDIEYILKMRQQGFETIDAIKARIGSLTKELEKVKIGSDRFSELTEEMRTAQGAVDSARSNFERYANTTDRATAFMREQRKEQRLQSFYLRETQQALGAVSLGLSVFGAAAGSSSGDINKLSNSLNQGFAAFQGFSFLLSGFSGPVGIGIAALGGLSAAFLSMNQQAKEGEVRLQDLDIRLNNLRVSIGDISKGAQLAFLNAELLKTKLHMVNLQNSTIDWGRTLFDITAPFDQNVIYKTVGSPEEIKLAEIKIVELRKSVEDLNKTIEKDASEGIAKFMEKVDAHMFAVLRKARFDAVVNLRPSMAGLDTKAFEKGLANIRDKGFKLPDIVPLSQLGSLNQLNEQLSVAEAELGQLEIGSDAWIRKMGEIAAIKAIMKKALLDPMEEFKRGWAIAVGFISRGINTISQLSASRSDAQIARIEQERDLEFARINDGLANEKLSEATRRQLIAERAKLEIQYDEQIRKEKARAFQADKEAKMIQAAIDTASAIVEALPNPFLVSWAAAMGAAQIAVIAGQPTPRFHQGGTVGGGLFLDAPPHREIPVLARGGETFRTEAQEAALGGGGGAIVNINFNSPVSDVQFVTRSIQKALRETGLPVEKLFVNRRSKISL